MTLVEKNKTHITVKLTFAEMSLVLEGLGEWCDDASANYKDMKIVYTKLWRLIHIKKKEAKNES